MGKYEDALNGFNLALKIRPKDTSALCNKANVFVALGRHDDAISIYKYALEINPGDIEILNNIGIVYAGEKQHYTAIEYFESALNKKKMTLIHYVILETLF